VGALGRGRTQAPPTFLAPQARSSVQDRQGMGDETSRGGGKARVWVGRTRTASWLRSASAHRQPRPTPARAPFVPGGIVHFPKETCAQRPLHTQCTTSQRGRSVSIHPDEVLLIELCQRQQTPEGRTKLRERVARSAYPRPCWSVARKTRTLSRTTEESLRSAPVRCRPKSARPGSLPAVCD